MTPLVLNLIFLQCDNVPMLLQDAKSDRVNKLLKETEKYLQKLGSKLKDAKAMAGQFKVDIDTSKGGTAEDSEDVENEDEKDQAKVSFIVWFQLLIPQFYYHEWIRYYLTFSLFFTAFCSTALFGKQ